MKRISLTLAAAALAVFSATSSAQSAKPVSLGLSLGASIPTGDFGDVYSTGYNGTVSLGFNSVGTPLGIRIDGMYNSFSDRDDLLIARPDYRIVSGNANLVYALPGVGIRPYLIGGAGMYGQKPDVSGAKNVTDFGVNGGIGAAFQLSGFSTFIEARYHHIFSDQATQFIPINFGISL
jgi:hypothetical protein